MKDYYSILGVSRHASSGEIKRAFRRLAIQYHPDHNRSAGAEAIIKDVIEAYSILEDPSQRALYDSMLSGESPAEVAASSGKRHRDPKYRYKPRDPDYKSEKQEMMELMKSGLPFARGASVCTFLVCIFLLLDFILPARQTTTTITGAIAGGSRSEEKIFTGKGKSLTINRSELSQLQRGIEVTVFNSSMLNIPLYIQNDVTLYRVRTPISIYGNFSFAPILLMITSILGITWNTGVIFRFNLGIVNCLLLFLTFVFVVIPPFINE